MTLVQYIETVLVPQLNTATGLTFTFLHGEREYQNLNDDVEFPVLFLKHPISSEDTLHKSGALTARYVLEFFFGKKSELDWTQAQHNDVIEPMRNAARKFIVLMQNAKPSISDVIRATRLDIINIFDVNMSGTVLTVTVDVRDGSAICV